MFGAALLSFALLCTGTLAAPSSRDRMVERVSRRAAGRHLSRPLERSGGQFIELAVTPGNTTTPAPEFSQNWAGAVWDSKPAGTFTSVTGTFTVPTPKEGAGSGGSYSASAWVGIDGDTCQTAILQTGVDFTVGGGDVSYDAWYEWLPDYAHDFTGISFSAGDVVILTVTASSTTAGKAVIENKTTGKKVTKSLTSTSPLCEQNAEWIVEDFEQGNSLVPFCNFDTVTFTDAYALSATGEKVTPAGATLIDIRQNNVTYTSASVSGDDLTVSYV